MPDFSSAIVLLEKPFEDLYRKTTGALQAKIKLFRAASRMKALHQRLYDSQRVKTIWHTDRPLSLSSFFHPAYVMRNAEGVASQIRLTSLDDLPDNHNILFGTVGQGKSIVIRYLLGKEIKSGTRVPVLCELRNVDSESLEEYLVDRFSLLLGISPDVEIFHSFAEDGKLSFLLDGFDEIDPARVAKIMQDIQDLSFKYPACRILLTSRPDSDCRHLTTFQANRLGPLSERELPEFYKRITKDQLLTDRLVAAIQASPIKIRELLKTPLLATLLAISYRAAHKIPLDFAEFYDELFQILLIRHDGAKMGWKRRRKTTLNDRQIQQIFEAFCFATRKRQAASIDREMAISLASDSIKTCDYAADPDLFIDDIKSITCLLVDEGKKLNFVHVSVQEFFASRYVRTRPEEVSRKFYEKLRDGKWDKWLEELVFLKQIDAHRANKYFFIPDLERTISDLERSNRHATSYAEDYLLRMRVERKKVKVEEREKSSFFVRVDRSVHSHRYHAIDSAIFKSLFENNIPGVQNWNTAFLANPNISQRSYWEIASDRGQAFSSKFIKFADGLIQLARKDLVDMREKIAKEELGTDFNDV